MAESRRVHLTTLAHYVPPSSFTSEAREAKTQPGRPADPDTVRLVLNLFEPDEQSFPEFSYSQLVDGKHNRAEDKVWLNRLEEERRDEDEAAALARALEEKYGGKAKNNDRIQDLIDIGYGYDEDDSFIDNSEPYDEFVPASLTTKLGGFYVNSGVLQFRLTSDPEDASRQRTPQPTKKRKINLGQLKPKKKVRKDGGMMTDKVPKTSALSSKVKKRRKKSSVTLSVTSMLKKFQREKEKLEGVQKEAAPPTIPKCPANPAGGGASGLTDPLLSLIGSTNEQALIQAASAMYFDIDLDSLLEASEGTAAPPPAPDPQHFAPKPEDFPQAPPPDAPPQLKPYSDQTSTTSPHQFVCLPDGVPAGLAAAIQKLALAARTSEGESKLKFFTPEVNSILLDIELQCRVHGGQLRSKVYTHLSSFLPCSRDTVLKRVKRLLLAHTLGAAPGHAAGCPPLPSDWLNSGKVEPPDVEGPLQKLKEAIGRTMPEQVARFRETCDSYGQLKSSRAAEEEKDVGPKLNLAAEDNLEERSGKRGGPRKMFRWTDEIRECLSQVLKAKLEKNKKEEGSQELEDFLKTLLDNEVKPLWPKGWMQSRVLMRESRKLLGLLPSFLVKKVRAEKKQPVVGGPAAPSGECGVLQASPRTTEAWTKPERRPGGAEAAAAGSSTPAGSAGRPRMGSAPGRSLLDLLANQTLAQSQLSWDRPAQDQPARDQPLLLPEELLAAAVANYTHSVRSWSFELDAQSPPLPPPPPHSSPAEFPVSGAYQSKDSSIQ